MLAGAAPFHAKAAMAFMRQHMVAEPPPLRARVPEVSKELGELVHSMLAKEPQARPDMAQVVEQLRKIQSPARYQDTLLVPEPARGQAVTWWLVGMVLILFTLAGALWVAWGRLFPALPTGPGAAPMPPTPTPTPTPMPSPGPPPLKPTPSRRPDLGSPPVTAPPPVAKPADAGAGPLDGAAPPDGETPESVDLEPPRADHEPSPQRVEPVEPAPTPRPVAHPVKRPPSKPAARPEARHRGGKHGKRSHSR
jgi:hypothetical protein